MIVTATGENKCSSKKISASPQAYVCSLVFLEQVKLYAAISLAVAWINSDFLLNSVRNAKASWSVCAQSYRCLLVRFARKENFSLNCQRWMTACIIPLAYCHCSLLRIIKKWYQNRLTLPILNISVLMIQNKTWFFGTCHLFSLPHGPVLTATCQCAWAVWPVCTYTALDAANCGAFGVLTPFYYDQN